MTRPNITKVLLDKGATDCQSLTMTKDTQESLTATRFLAYLSSKRKEKESEIAKSQAELDCLICAIYDLETISNDVKKQLDKAPLNS